MAASLTGKQRLGYEVPQCIQGTMVHTRLFWSRAATSVWPDLFWTACSLAQFTRVPLSFFRPTAASDAVHAVSCLSGFRLRPSQISHFWQVIRIESSAPMSGAASADRSTDGGRHGLAEKATYANRA